MTKTINDVYMQLFRQLLLRKIHFGPKLPNANDPKGEKQALVLSQKQDLLHIHRCFCQQENLTNSYSILPRPMGRILSILVEIPILLLYHR